MTAQDKLHTAGCIQGGQPPCTCGCPLNFDIKKFITKIRAGNLQTSYRDLANRTVFPGIVCHICDQRCMQACPANLSMQALEQACVTHVRNRDAQTWALPKKKQRVAILGAGIAGMACAQKLATKKYEVTVYDRADQTGGNLRQILDESIIQAEFSHQFHNLDYTLLLNHEVRTTDHLDQDAIFIATGSGGMDFGLRAGWNGQSMATKKAGVFLGGMLMRENRMDALADGIIAAISIERYLLVASMSGQQESFYSHECTLPPANGREIATPVKATGDGYTKEEAAEEAARCLLCDCTKCYDTCQFMQSFRSFPRRIEVEAMNARVTEQNLVDRVGTKLIASCALCGHCTAVCGGDVNLELLMRESKRHLFESGSFAPTWHEFYLRDMEEAMGPSWLARPAPGFDRARYLFFPGCQSLESDPDAMAAVYGYLRKHYPSTAILMACCGVPALYAGNIKAMEDVHRRILTAWEQLGKPVALLACPTCAKTFAEFLPDIPWKSIYEVIVKNGLPEDSRPREAFAAKRWALFDPCASRNFPDMQEAVRDLCLSMGMSCAELPESRERALCCGMGGHIYPANPSLSDRMVKAAADQSNLPYLTFCSNCRNQFLFAGKETIHVLDAVFGIAPQKQSLHLLERKENRRLLKKQWLADGRDEQGLAPEAERMKKKAAFKLHFDESLLRKMDRLLISVEDVYETVSFAETQKLSIVNEETGMNIAHRRLGYITYWVIYRRAGIKIDVINVYSHRIRVLEPLDTLETGRA